MLMDNIIIVAVVVGGETTTTSSKRLSQMMIIWEERTELVRATGAGRRGRDGMTGR